MKYKMVIINNEKVVKFTKRDVRLFLENRIIFYNRKRSNEGNIKDALMLSERISALQLVYVSLFGYYYPQ